MPRRYESQGTVKAKYRDAAHYMMTRFDSDRISSDIARIRHQGPPYLARDGLMKVWRTVVIPRDA